MPYKDPACPAAKARRHRYDMSEKGKLSKLKCNIRQRARSRLAAAINLFNEVTSNG